MKNSTIYISYVHLPKDKRGAQIAGEYSTKNKKHYIKIHDKLSEPDKIKTLFHEYTHYILREFSKRDGELVTTKITEETPIVECYVNTEEKICKQVATQVKTIFDKNLPTRNKLT